jgi:hypothetical protein
VCILSDVFNFISGGYVLRPVAMSIRTRPEDCFFKRSDWMGFGFATCLALAVYLYTLSPELTFEWSGMYATAAMYGGVSPPPGFPTWTIYGWVFIKLLPFGNIAWRLAVSSAVAGALTAGLIALMVSRGSKFLLQRTRRLRRLAREQEVSLRLVCGVVAGLGFAFHGVFWYFSVVAESTALAHLFLALVFCLLLRWTYRPRRMRYLCAAAFTYGLAISVHSSMAALSPALPFVVIFIERRVGRDLMGGIIAVLAVALVAGFFGVLPYWLNGRSGLFETPVVYFLPVIAIAITSALAAIRSREFMTRWRAVLGIGVAFLIGLTPYLSIPIVSMTNPPSNWGYARTAEGFDHVLSRGQYEKMNPMDLLSDADRLFVGLRGYATESLKAMGWVYLLPVLATFAYLFWLRGRGRAWLLGLIACFLALSVFMLVMLNPPPNRGAWEITELYFMPSQLVLSIIGGYGLVFTGTLMSGRRGASRVPRTRARECRPSPISGGPMESW